MSENGRTLATLAAAAALLIFLPGAPASLADAQTGAGASPSAQQTYQDIEATLGGVPTFMKEFPAAGIPGAWQEFKSIQLSPDTALPGKVKELIGIAVAAQIPCEYCVYFHTSAAKLNGATDEEVREAVAMAAITRHWSTVLNGAQIDKAAFRQETDHMMQLAADKMKSGSDTRPATTTK